MLVKLADSVIKKSIDSIKGKINREDLIAAAQKAAAAILKNAKDDIFVDVEKDAEGYLLRDKGDGEVHTRFQIKQ